MWACRRQLSRYSDSLHTGRPADRILVGARLTAPPSTHQRPLQWKPGLFSGGVKRPGRGVDHPLHLATRLKNEQSHASTPPLALQGLFWGQLYQYPSQMRVIRPAPGFNLPIYKGLNG